MVLTSYMVGNKIHDDVHSCLMSAQNQLLPLFHSHFWVIGQIGIYVVIIGYGVGGTGFSLDNFRVLGRNAYCRIIRG